MDTKSCGLAQFAPVGVLCSALVVSKTLYLSQKSRLHPVAGNTLWEKESRKPEDIIPKVTC